MIIHICTMNNSVFISKELRLDGNNLCLNFVNTIYDRLALEVRDLIVDKEDWITWLRKTGLLEKNIVFSNDVGFDLEYVTDTRELFYRIFKSLSHNRTVLKKDLKHFEQLLLKARKATKLSIIDNVPKQELIIDDNNLSNYVLPIIKSAHDLFISDKIVRIKECNHCGWLYLDTSKNNSRKWCSMESCGSQVKAKRYYQNKKKLKT